MSTLLHHPPRPTARRPAHCGSSLFRCVGWLAVVTGCLLARPGYAQRDWSKVAIRTEAAGPGVYMLTGAGGNIGVCVGPDGTLLIDGQFAPLSDRILAEIARLGGGPVRFLINTHYHADHTGGNENIGKAGALLFAHDNVRARLSTVQISPTFRDTTRPSPAGALPMITFTDSVTFHMNGQAIQVVHLAPAHTDGDVVVHFPGSNVIDTGDIYFNGIYPLIDIDAGGSIRGVIAGVDRLLEMAGPATRLIPGHGPLSNRDELKAYREMLQGVADQVQKEIDAGKSREEAVAAKPTAAWDAKWGGGFMKPDTFAGIVYDDLARPAGRHAVGSPPASPAGGKSDAAPAPAGGKSDAASAPAGHIQLQHILIGFSGSVPGKNITRTPEEARTLAYQVLELAQAGADFDSLVKKWTDDSFPGIYGLSNFKVPPAAGEYPRERMVPAFGNVGFSLVPGSVGIADYDPKTSKYGWHVIKRLK